MDIKPKLTKNELIKRLSEYTHYRAADIQIILDAYYIEFKKALLEGKRVGIPDCVMIELRKSERRYCSDFSGRLIPMKHGRYVPHIKTLPAFKSDLEKLYDEGMTCDRTEIVEQEVFFDAT